VFLYERAASDHQLEMAHSFVVGDSPDDMRAARNLGARGCLVRTGWAADRHVIELARQDTAFLADSITGAVDWILNAGA